MAHATKPDIFAEIFALIDLIESAKNAGDYFNANLFFVAALHIITRNKRDLSAQTFKLFFSSKCRRRSTSLTLMQAAWAITTCSTFAAST